METMKRAAVKPKAGEPGYMSPADKRLHASLCTGYEGIGGVVIAIGNAKNDDGLKGVGLKCVNNADRAADAWIELAAENPKIKAMLLRFTETSKVGVLVGIHVAMFVPLLADRGIVPPEAALMADMYEMQQRMEKQAAAEAAMNGDQE